MPILLPSQGLAQSLRWFSDRLLQNNEVLIQWQHIATKEDCGGSQNLGHNEAPVCAV